MSSDVEKFVIDRITQAPMVHRPFRHFFVDGVFPEAYYARLLASMPSDDSYVSLGDTGRVPKGAYKDRFVFMLNEDEFLNVGRHSSRLL